MASTGQNITIFDKDNLTVRFIVTDTETALNTANARAWWGIADNASDTSLNFEKTSGAWNASSPAQGATPGNETPNIDIDASTITCYLTHSDYAGDTTSDIDLYHELVFSSQGRGDRSLTVASGDFTIRPSLFTLKGYR